MIPLIFLLAASYVTSETQVYDGGIPGGVGDFHGGVDTGFDDSGELAVGHGIGGGNYGVVCGPGEILHVDGSCVHPHVTRNIFVYAAPEHGISYGPPPPIPKPKINYNVVFVRTPDFPKGLEPIIVPPPQEKTIVYVLTKNGHFGQQVIEIPAGPGQKPEVFYVNYNDGENPVLPGGISLQDALSSAVSFDGQVFHGPGGGGFGKGVVGDFDDGIDDVEFGNVGHSFGSGVGGVGGAVSNALVNSGHGLYGEGSGAFSHGGGGGGVGGVGGAVSNALVNSGHGLYGEGSGAFSHGGGGVGKFSHGGGVHPQIHFQGGVHSFGSSGINYGGINRRGVVTDISSNEVLFTGEKTPGSVHPGLGGLVKSSVDHDQFITKNIY